MTQAFKSWPSRPRYSIFRVLPSAIPERKVFVSTTRVDPESRRESQRKLPSRVAAVKTAVPLPVSSDARLALGWGLAKGLSFPEGRSIVYRSIV